MDQDGPEQIRAILIYRLPFCLMMGRRAQFLRIFEQFQFPYFVFFGGIGWVECVWRAGGKELPSALMDWLSGLKQGVSGILSGSCLGGDWVAAGRWAWGGQWGPAGRRAAPPLCGQLSVADEVSWQSGQGLP